jgi:hypothetical protein
VHDAQHAAHIGGRRGARAHAPLGLTEDYGAERSSRGILWSRSRRARCATVEALVTSELSRPKLQDGGMARGRRDGSRLHGQVGKSRDKMARGLRLAPDILVLSVGTCHGNAIVVPTLVIAVYRRLHSIHIRSQIAPSAVISG